MINKTKCFQTLNCNPTQVRSSQEVACMDLTCQVNQHHQARVKTIHRTPIEHRGQSTQKSKLQVHKITEVNLALEQGISSMINEYYKMF